MYSKILLSLRVQYAGDWYQTWETPVAFVAEGNACTRAQYGSFEQGLNNVSVYNIGVDADGSISDICGWAQGPSINDVCTDFADEQYE